MVMNVNFHHPAVIAHGMASLDELSGGRAELGLGGGWYAPEHEAFGLPWGEPRERAERLLEAAALCRQMLEHRGVAVHHGAHFDVDNQVAWDWEAKGHTVPVVIGGAAPSLLCRAAEVANRVDLLHAAAGGSPVIDAGHSRSADLVEALIKDLRDRAAAAGNTVSISATLTASLVPDDEAAAARERAAPALRSTPALLSRDLLYVIGGQGELMARIVALAELGVDRIHVIPAPPDPGRTVAAVREMLADVQRL
jgi:alkanesulfonate monooxygenase SsuD/methylene tetrahydromethanopterin reductase-like flavin-dependent oxidoreductase (luciferase family)